MSLRAYARPESINSKKVIKLTGKNINCPNCSESTKTKNDIGWVKCPIIKSNGWLCSGCCIDFCTTCNKDNPKDDPLFDEIEKIAYLNNLSESELVLKCLNHQLSILYTYNDLDEDHIELKVFIENKLEREILQKSQET